jgi:RNA polymerase sigma-70 factor (ECF subfamily)
MRALLLLPPVPFAADPAVARPLVFAEVYEQCFECVWGALRRFGVADEALEDAVQDVFVIVHRRLGEFEGRSSVRSWVFGIAVNVARHHRRTRRRRGDPLPLPERLEDPALGPHEQVARLEAAELLEVVLDALPDERRTVLVLAEFQELTAPEIADALGVPLNTVYSRLRTARAEFEAALRRFSARRDP